jgi:NADH:ubiquinone oxidoreductase subunit F (NADH-binding)
MSWAKKNSATDNPSLEAESFYHLHGKPLQEERCQGMACFVAEARDPTHSLPSPVSDKRVYCLGKCFASPAASQEPKRPLIEVHAREAIVLSRIAEGRDSSLKGYLRQSGYQALEAALRTPRDELVRQVEDSGLRGRGGAGFPTGRKWQAVFSQKSCEKFVIANADEGDPGAYIDRFIMEEDPHGLIEALAIAGYTVGAKKGYLYIRCEYPRAQEILRQAIAEARGEGFLGERILRSDFAFDVEMVSGQGSYVCGEETALLNSIEGKRAEVRSRPPYPAQHGLYGKPTLINNVETLANIPWIIRRGCEAYSRLGFAKSRGTKVVSLNSLFQRPGLYEIEFGMPVRQIVEEIGGGLKSGEIKGVVIGGPLAGIIPPQLFDTTFGFEELRAIGASVGHGGVIAFDRHTSVADLLHHIFAFGAYESCGKCTPCRVGSRRLEQIFQEVLAKGQASHTERQECDEIVAALAQSSLCGLGTGLAEFAQSAAAHYQEEYSRCFASS